MKKLMFSALACVAFAFSGFASNEVVKEEKVSNENIVIETEVTESIKTNEKVEFAKNCAMNVYNANNVLVGTVIVTDVPNNISCGSDAVKKRAIEIHNKGLMKSL